MDSFFVQKKQTPVLGMSMNTTCKCIFSHKSFPAEDFQLSFSVSAFFPDKYMRCKCDLKRNAPCPSYWSLSCFCLFRFGKEGRPERARPHVAHLFFIRLIISHLEKTSSMTNHCRIIPALYLVPEFSRRSLFSLQCLFCLVLSSTFVYSKYWLYCAILFCLFFSHVRFLLSLWDKQFIFSFSPLTFASAFAISSGSLLPAWLFVLWQFRFLLEYLCW